MCAREREDGGVGCLYKQQRPQCTSKQRGINASVYVSCARFHHVQYSGLIHYSKKHRKPVTQRKFDLLKLSFGMFFHLCKMTYMQSENPVLLC